jgi:type IV secretion system protein VirB10
MNSERQSDDSESTAASADVPPDESGAEQSSPAETAAASGGHNPSHVGRVGDGSGVRDERGIPSVNRARSVQSRVTSILGVSLVSITALGLLSWYYHRALSHSKSVDSRLHDSARARAQGYGPLPPLGPIHPPRMIVPTAGTPAATAPAADPMETLLGPPPPPPGTVLAAPSAATPLGPYGRPAGAAPAAPAARHESRRELDLERRLRGVVASSATASAAPGGTGEPMASRDAEGLAPAVVDGGSDASGVGSVYPTAARQDAQGRSLNALLTPAVTTAVSAQVLPTQRFLIPKGAFIDCTLETAIDSTLPGMTTCITATDTFGADGKIVLLERGTKLVGETRGEVEQGQARLFVLWTEARTPSGVVVPLASPSTDALGRSGLTGAVNRHFWQRFGAAMLVSVIDGGVQAAALASEKNSGALIVSPSTSSDIIEEVLRGTINIPPTITVPQGSRIEVLVARDLDFRPVYELRMLKVRTAATTEPSR